MSEVDDNGNPIEGAQDEQVDPLHNLKSEFNRKTDNLAQQVQESNRKLEEVMNTILSKYQTQEQPANQGSQKSMKDLIFEDADQAASIIEQRASAAAERRIDEKLQSAQQSQAVVNEVMNIYPEFGAQGSEAAKLAIEKMSKLPRNMQGTTQATKMVMLEAAAELGLTPMKSRSQRNNDDFSLSGQSGGTTREARKQTQSKVSAETLEFAELLGVDLKDPKRLEGLKQASDRKIWNKYR